MEPVRAYLYGLLAPVVAVLVGYATAVLGVPAVELARRRVTPTGKE